MRKRWIDYADWEFFKKWEEDRKYALKEFWSAYIKKRDKNEFLDKRI